MEILLIGDRVMVKLDPRDAANGAIIIPDAHKKPSEWGTVVEVGPKVRDLKEGDRVYVQKHLGTVYASKTAGEFVFLREDQVLLKLLA